jgi:hypothetical protein
MQNVAQRAGGLSNLAVTCLTQDHGGVQQVVGAAHQQPSPAAAAAAVAAAGFALELRHVRVLAAATLWGVGCMRVCPRMGPALADMLRCLG